MERIPSEDGRNSNQKLTLGSAVRDGRFLRTVDEGRFAGSRAGESQFDRSSRIVNSDYFPGKEGGGREEEEDRKRETVRNGYELRSFPGGARDEEKGVETGGRV